MELSQATQKAIEHGGLVAIAPNGDYEVFESETSARESNYEPLLGVIKGTKLHVVMVYVKYPNEANGNESMLINVMGAMLNPKLNEPLDHIAKAKRQANWDAQTAEKDAQRQQEHLDEIYRFATECVRMELNLRGFPEDEPILCFEPSIGSSGTSKVGTCPHCGFSPLGYGEYCESCNEELEPFDIESWHEDFSDNDTEPIESVNS